MSERVHVQMDVIGDPLEADRCLDEMERTTGLRGDRNEKGRLYLFEGETLSAAADRIAAHLPKGWQDYLAFEL